MLRLECAWRKSLLLHNVLQTGVWQGLLLKQACNVVVLALFFLPRVPALVPRAAYYTEFEVAAPANSTLLHDIAVFLNELCAAVPMLPCGAALNVTAS